MDLTAAFAWVTLRRVTGGATGTMRWFGRGEHPHLPTVDPPIGAMCLGCREPIRLTDEGFILVDGSVIHQICFARSLGLTS